MPSAAARSVLCVCALASACHSQPPPSSAQTAQPEPTVAAEPDASPPETTAPPETTDEPEEPVAAPPPSAPDPEVPVTAQFGLALPPGHYTFPNGLRLRFSAKHECEYDSTDPCSPFDVVAWFQGKSATANILPGNTTRVVGHLMQVTADQSLVVRK